MAYKRNIVRYFTAPRPKPRTYDKDKVIRIISNGTLIVAIALVSLLVLYDVTLVGNFRFRTFVGFGVVVYTLITALLVRTRHIRFASWLLILLYQFLVLGMLVQWGINAPVGVLAICFITFLPGILLGSRYIFPILGLTVIMIVFAHLLHAKEFYAPDLEVLSAPSTFWDVLVYVTVISILALLSWLSKSQTEKSLVRAATAESRLKDQKQLIASELKQESIKLRQIQLKQFRQLYQFALIGQSTAATLHELSNQLSELNFDIDDLNQQHKNSETITRAKETIGHINYTVRQARQQLNSYASGGEVFDGLAIIRNAVDDTAAKFEQHEIKLIKTFPHSSTKAPLSGTPIALMQITSILLNNALEACQNKDNAWIELSASVQMNSLYFKITDSGIGINGSARKALFKPKASSKPGGLGVGLYIAKHLVTTQFLGTIKLAESSDHHGAQFIITLPLLSSGENNQNEK